MKISTTKIKLWVVWAIELWVTIAVFQHHGVLLGGACMLAFFLIEMTFISSACAIGVLSKRVDTLTAVVNHTLTLMEDAYKKFPSGTIPVLCGADKDESAPITLRDLSTDELRALAKKMQTRMLEIRSIMRERKNEVHV